ncbi:MAG: alkaline phosphatase family protein [Fidelibacterota bacterium]
MRRLRLSLFAFLFWLFPLRPQTTPALVVFISIDQFPNHIIQRLNPYFTGGFRWLLDHGVYYRQAYHEHSYTATGPGHFVLSSGRYPGPGGILGNTWYDREQKKVVYCVDDILGLSGSEAALPPHLQTWSSLGDWLKTANPRSKVYSLAVKDRASILLGGLRADLSIWYDPEKGFTTAPYFTATLPAWLNTFNRTFNILAYRDSLWRRELDPTVYQQIAREDFYPGETDRYHTNPYSPVFPIGFDREFTDDDLRERIRNFPWLDREVLRLAATIVRENQLGLDSDPDVLFIGLSTSDWVGHYYGPYSQEVMDHFLKLDHYLEGFLNRLDETVGLDRVTFVLASDHGGSPLPEYVRKKYHQPAGRINHEQYIQAWRDIDKTLRLRYGTAQLYVRHALGVYYDHESITRLGVPTSELDELFRKTLEAIPGIRRVYTKGEVLSATREDTLMIRIKHFYHPEKSPDLYILQEKYWLFRMPYGSSHGTPYEYDTHVPIILARAGQTSTAVSTRVATVDLAPTVAKILNIPIPSDVDGTPLPER